MPKLKTRLTIAAATALGALLLLPAAGQAATNFGSRFSEEPSNAGECMELGPCTFVSFIHPSDPNGDPYAGGAPVDGVITKFRIKAFGEEGTGTATATFRVADIERPNPEDESTALAATTGTGPTVTIPEGDSSVLETPITEIGGHVPVKKGQHLAIDGSPNIWATSNDSGDQFSYVFAPPLVDGSGKRGSNQSTGELLVAGTIEPDADGDGFGDETQDQCSVQKTTQGPCDFTKPGVSDLKVTNGKVHYKLSEAATVSFQLEKKKKGRRVGGKCVKQTAKNKTKKACPLFKKVGAKFNGPGKQGNNQVTLPNGKKLKPGTYRLTMTATDAAGNTTTKTTTFKVAKKKKKK
jgi:hypothetical protein